MNKEKEVTSLFSSPIKLITASGKFGISGLFKMIGMLLLFSLLNIFLFFYFMSKGNNSFSRNSLVVFIGFIFTFIAAYKTYRYILVNAFAAVYERISPFFTNVSSYVIDKSEDLLNSKVNLKNNRNAKAIDLTKLLNDHFDKVPGILKMGMTFIINRVPFVELLSDLKQDYEQDHKLQASNQLNEKVDTFIQNQVFGTNNTKWVYWLLPLNIVIQYMVKLFL